MSPFHSYTVVSFSSLVDMTHTENIFATLLSLWWWWWWWCKKRAKILSSKRISTSITFCSSSFWSHILSFYHHKITGQFNWVFNVISSVFLSPTFFGDETYVKCIGALRFLSFIVNFSIAFCFIADFF